MTTDLTKARAEIERLTEALSTESEAHKETQKELRKLKR